MSPLIPLSEDPRMDRLEEILRGLPQERQEMFIDTLTQKCNTEVTPNSTGDHPNGESTQGSTVGPAR